jgi:hypothetical protein
LLFPLLEELDDDAGDFAQRGELQSRILARQLRRDQLQSISVSQEHLHGLSLPPKVRGRVSVVLDLPALKL